MRRDCPLTRTRRPLAVRAAARPPYQVHLLMPACVREDCVHTPAADAVMGNYLLRRSGPGSAARVEICQKPAITVSRHAKQLPTPKSDHPRRTVSGFVIRTQPRWL